MPTSRHFLARWSPIALLASLVLALTTCWSAGPAQGVTSYTLWSRSAPTTVVIGNETVGIELGNKFTAVVAGQVTHVRFYKTSVNTGTHIGSLWDSSGRRLASVTFTGETSSGWQVAKFATPVSVKAGSTYMVSYFAPKGRYAATNDFYGAPANPKYLTFTPGSQAFFSFGSAPLYPRNVAYRHSEYWVDLEFVPSAPAASAPTTTTPPAPAPTTTTPTATQTTVVPASITNCAADPSRCGYPDADNTGVPAGVALKRVPQDVTSGQGWQWMSSGYLSAGSNARVENLIVNGDISVSGTGAIIRNNQIRASGETFGIAIRHTTNAVIEYNDIGVSGSTRLMVGIKDIYGDSVNTVVRRNDIVNTSTGVQMGSGLIEANYIHAMGYQAGDHVNGTTSNGGTTQLTIRGNTIFNQVDQTDAISLFQDFGVEANRLITGNLIAGGGYSLYAGDNRRFGVTYNVKVTNNRFSTVFFPKAGAYGPYTAFDRSGSGNVWSGNTWDATGASVA